MKRRFLRLPISSGMGPVILFKLSSRLTKFLKLPSSIGIFPVILLLKSSLSKERYSDLGRETSSE